MKTRSSLAFITNLLLFGLCFFVVLKAVDYAIRYATRLARLFQVSEFVISFMIVAVISVMPETVISMVANLEGKGDVAFIALIGSNVVDLTFVFGIVAIFSKGISVSSKVVRQDALYLALLVLPLLLGIDGIINRSEGVLLILGGLFFFYTLIKQKTAYEHKSVHKSHSHVAYLIFVLTVSLAVMLVSAHYTIHFLSAFAIDIGVPAFLVALLVIGTGVCLPELLFTIESVRKNHSDLALGDVLGTVVIDSTIVLGLIALIEPIFVPVTLLRVTAFFSALAGCVLIYFLKVNKHLSKVEGFLLLAFYLAFIAMMFTVQYG